MTVKACAIALFALPLVFVSGCDRARAERNDARDARVAAAHAARAAAAKDSSARAQAQRVPPPPIMRGLYVNRWAALGKKLPQLIDVAKTTEINALVIDVKDDRGFVLYRSRVPLAHQIGADTVSPMPRQRLRALLDTMRAYSIYPIARIVVAKDPLLAWARLDWAVKRKSDLQPWLDKKGQPWLDPHRREIWKYAADLAEEAYDLGFSEVQFDYVRFPDEKRFIRETAFPLAAGRIRAQVIRDQLGYTRELLRRKGVRMTIDVFGLSATDTTDMGIGQRWEMFVDRADVILPMNYPSHFARGTYKLANPNARPYATIDHALKDVTRRTLPVRGAGKVIPWYQDFTLGPPRYGVEQIRAQIQAGYDNGYYDWILWNPGSRYTIAALKPKSALEDDRRRMAADSVRRSTGDTAKQRSDSTTKRTDTTSPRPLVAPSPDTSVMHDSASGVKQAR